MSTKKQIGTRRRAQVYMCKCKRESNARGMDEKQNATALVWVSDDPDVDGVHEPRHANRHPYDDQRQHSAAVMYMEIKVKVNINIVIAEEIFQQNFSTVPFKWIALTEYVGVRLRTRTVGGCWRRDNKPDRGVSLKPHTQLQPAKYKHRKVRWKNAIHTHYTKGIHFTCQCGVAALTHTVVCAQTIRTIRTITITTRTRTRRTKRRKRTI